jgi:aryl-alcohol dehydrogenase-like predicted oxidoreductase
MKTHQLGALGPEIGAIGLGCMGMSWGYAESSRDDVASVRVIHRALDEGATLIDTADVYGDGHNESLVGAVARRRRAEMTVATKVGLVVDDLSRRQMHRLGTPQHIRDAADASLRRLQTDVIDLLYLHRADPAVPLLDTWGAMAGLVSAGKVRQLGLSEVSVAQAAAAHAAHPVSAIQSEFSLWTPAPRGEPGGPEEDPAGEAGDVVTWCGRSGVAFVPYAPLGRGFLTGTFGRAPEFEESDFRVGNPRFLPGAFSANLRIVDAARQVASRHGATLGQVAIAWTMAHGEHVTPIPGTRSLRHLTENLGAASLRLDPADLAELAQVPAAVGARY